MTDWKGDKLFEYVVSQVRSGRCRVRSHNLEIDCPACHGHMKFSIHAERGAYGCFTCPLSGTIRHQVLDNRLRWVPVRDLVHGRDEMTGRRASAATRTGGDGISLPFYTLAGDRGSLQTPTGLPTPFPSAVEGGIRYCLGRGMTMGQISTYRVGILPMVPRVYFPYWDDKGTVTYWMGRSIHSDVEPKTLEPGDRSEKPLFGRHVNSWTGGPMLLVEGVFDHFTTPNSVAMMGSFISNYQVNQIREMGPPWVALVLDPDAIGKSMQICKRLWESGIKCACLRWDKVQKDPGDLGFSVMAGVQQLLEKMSVPVRPCIMRVRL